MENANAKNLAECLLAFLTKSEDETPHLDALDLSVTQESEERCSFTVSRYIDAPDGTPLTMHAFTVTVKKSEHPAHEV